MNYDRQRQASSMTSDGSFQLQELGDYSDFVPGVDDLGRHSEDMSTWNDALGAPEIKVDEWDKIGYSPSSSYQFYFALAIGIMVAGVAAGWSLGLNTHQSSGSNPATIEQKQIITDWPAPGFVDTRLS